MMGYPTLCTCCQDPGEGAWGHDGLVGNARYCVHVV